MGINTSVGWLWFFIVLLFIIVITYIFYSNLYIKSGTIALEFSMIYNDVLKSYVFTNKSSPTGLYGSYVTLDDIYLIGSELTIPKYNMFNNSMLITTQIYPVNTHINQDVSNMYIIEEFGMLSLLRWDKTEYTHVDWKSVPIQFHVCVKFT